MGEVTRRGFLAGGAALGLTVAAAAFVPESRDSLKDFGAVADGTFDAVSGRMTGTDNTEAINAALRSGRPVLMPPGLFYYSGLLHTDIHGSGLVGSGNQASYLITDRSMDRHLAVVEETRNTKWINFGMIGPFNADGDDYNRALTIGIDDRRSQVSTCAWDAKGTWIDGFSTYGYCVGVHVSRADDVRFGSVHVFEAGDSRAEPGSYGISCSGSRLRGKLLRAANVSTRARHALYYTGPANDCFVDVVEARGFDFAPIRNRATKGGGQRNGFGFARFEDCNTNSLVEPGTVRGLVDFVCSNDEVVAGAGKASLGSYIATNCAGMPGPSLRYMPNSDCGTVQAFGHTYSGEAEPYGAHIYHSDNVRLPLLVLAGCSDASDSEGSVREPLVLEASSGCYGGGVRCVPL